MSSKYQEIQDEIGLSRTEEVNLEKNYQTQNRKKIEILQVHVSSERKNNSQIELENESKMRRFMEDALEISMIRADSLQKQKNQLNRKLKMSIIDMEETKTSFRGQYDLQTKRTQEYLQKYNEAICKINDLEDLIEHNSQNKRMEEKDRFKEKQDLERSLEYEKRRVRITKKNYEILLASEKNKNNYLLKKVQSMNEKNKKMEKKLEEQVESSLCRESYEKKVLQSTIIDCKSEYDQLIKRNDVEKKRLQKKVRVLTNFITNITNVQHLNDLDKMENQLGIKRASQFL